MMQGVEVSKCSYTTNEGHGLARHDDPSPTKYIRESASDGEGDG